MTPDRWQHILNVFNAAIERPPSDRAAYLDDACADDADLRAEVVSLLATYDEDPAFLEDPAARRRTLPEGNPDIAASLDGLGTALIESGQAPAAAPLLREALAIRQQVYEEGDWRIAQVEGHLGKALVRQGRYAEAESLLVRSYETLQATRGPNDLHTRYVLTALVDWATATRQPDHAATYQALLADMP